MRRKKVEEHRKAISVFMLQQIAKKFSVLSRPILEMENNKRSKHQAIYLGDKIIQLNEQMIKEVTRKERYYYFKMDRTLKFFVPNFPDEGIYLALKLEQKY